MNILTVAGIALTSLIVTVALIIGLSIYFEKKFRLDTETAAAISVGSAVLLAGITLIIIGLLT